LYFCNTSVTALGQFLALDLLANSRRISMLVRLSIAIFALAFNTYLLMRFAVETIGDFLHYPRFAIESELHEFIGNTLKIMTAPCVGWYWPQRSNAHSFCERILFDGTPRFHAFNTGHF
jgi:hypothetical protein